MKGSTPAATALAIGYLLGRRRKLRTAAIMAAATAVGRTSLGSQVVRQGVKRLGGIEALAKVSPQFGDIADAVRGDLVTAGKAAAMTAVNSKIDALTDSIHERAERVRNTAEREDADEGPDDDYEADDDYADDAGDDYDADADDADADADDDAGSDDEPEEFDDSSSDSGASGAKGSGKDGGRSAPRRSTQRRSPVTRTRR